MRKNILFLALLPCLFIIPFLSSCNKHSNHVNLSFDLNYFKKYNPVKNKYFHKYPTRDYTKGKYSGNDDDANMVSDLNKILDKYFIVSGFLSLFYDFYLFYSSSGDLAAYNLNISYTWENGELSNYFLNLNYQYNNSEITSINNLCVYQYPYSKVLINKVNVCKDGEGNYTATDFVFLGKDKCFFEYSQSPDSNEYWMYDYTYCPFNISEFSKIQFPINTIE